MEEKTKEKGNMGEDRRKLRLNALLEYIKFHTEEKGGISVAETIGWLGLTYGLRAEVSQEYVKILINAAAIENRNGILIWQKKE